MRIISLFWLLITSLTVFGQMRYPVQVEARVTAPSVFLADYKTPQNVSVRVVLHDLTKDNYTVQLKMTLKSPTATFTTVNPLSITLNGGEVRFLNHSELEFLFGQLSAAFSGGAMREDIYILSFEAFDARVPGLAVSNAKADFTQFKVNLVAAPMQTMPQDKAMLDNMGGTSPIMFSWMQSTVGMPAGQQIRYRLILAKITSESITPEMAIASATEADPSTIIVNDIPYNSYLLNDFSITPGDRYAWQVQSYEEIDGIATPVTTRFKDGGLSPVHSFTIKENCESILPLKKPEILKDAAGEPQIALEWKKSPSHQMYEIKYRPVGAASSWNVIQQEIDNTLTLGADLLKAGQTYEYTVAARCRTWQPAQYGGTFSIDAPSCPAPENLQIKTNTPAGIELAWDAVPSASSYLVTYSTASASDKQTVSSPAATLPAITAGSYTVQVDAVCASATGNGKPTTFNWDANGYLGECLIPKPFDLSVSTFDDKGSLSASLIWTAAPQHTAYTFTYTKDGTSTQTQLNTEDPYGTITKLSPNTLYHYTLQYFCGSRSVTTPTGMFRTDAGAQPVNIAPGTADCFPPAYISAEPRSLTSAEFAWKKTGADEYQLMYAPAGTQDFKTFSTTGSDCQIKDLVSGGKYDYKLRTRCGADYSIFSALGTVDLSKSTLNTKCDTLPFVKVIKTTKTEVQLAWKYELGTDSKPLRSGYEILYIDAAQDWSEQYTTSLMNMTEVVAKNVTKDSVTYTVINLNPGTTYKFKLRAYCGTDPAQTNAIVSGTTKSGAPKGDCENGRTCDRSSKILKPTINVGDSIQVADYSLKVATIEKLANGYWKGTGTAEAPFIGFSENIALEATFNNLQVNDKACVIGGEIDIKKATGYILDESQRTKLEAAMAKANNYIDKAASAVDAAQNGIDQAQEATAEAADYFQGGGGVGIVKSGSLGEQYTTSTSLDGQKGVVNANSIQVSDVEIPLENVPALIKDVNNVVYVVSADGSLEKVGKYNDAFTAAKLNEKPISSLGILVNFSPSSNMIFGFDDFKEEYANRPMMSGHYLKIDDKYFSAKSIVQSRIDYVNVSISGYPLSEISFVNRDGFVFEKDNNTIKLVGGPALDAQEVFAVIEKDGEIQIVGALLLASYPVKEKTVKLILTDSNQKISTQNIKELEQSLNRTFGPAGLNYTVEIDASIVDQPWCNALGCSFTPSESSDLTNDYTGDEASIINFYKSHSVLSPDPNIAYIFAVGVALSGTDGAEGELQGKMNFGKQFGFLYNVTNSSNFKLIGRTLAHELGHGNYNLYHIFDDMYLGKSALLSDNLMSYSTSADAVQLNKLQWDILHNPGVTWGFMASDKDQEFVNIIIGAVIGAAVDVVMQIGMNYLDDEKVDKFDINWWDVGISAAAGAVSSGAGSVVKLSKFATSPLGKKAVTKLAETATDFLIGVVSDVASDYANDRDPQFIENVMFNLISSSLFSIGGEGLDLIKKKIQDRFPNLKPKKVTAGAPSPKSPPPPVTTSKADIVKLNQAKKLKTMINPSSSKKVIYNIENIQYKPGTFVKCIEDDFKAEWMQNAEVAKLFSDIYCFNGFHRILLSSQYTKAIANGKKDIKYFIAFIKQQGVLERSIALSNATPFINNLDEVADIAIIGELSLLKQAELKELDLLVSQFFSNNSGKTISDLRKDITDAGGYLQWKTKNKDVLSLSASTLSQLKQLGVGDDFIDEFVSIQKIKKSASCDDNCIIEGFGCFTDNTPVKTSKGLLPIQNLQVGDTLWSYNDSLRKLEKKTIRTIKSATVRTLCIVSLSCGMPVNATPEHPFYSAGQYIEAQNLKTGDELLTYSGDKCQVTTVKTVDTIALVHNLEVEDNSNFYVGEQPVLVHNSDCLLKWLSSPDMKALADVVDKLTPESLKARFLDDLASGGDELRKVFKDNPELVDSWSDLYKAGRTGGTNPANGLTRNIEAIEALDALKKYDDAILDKIGLNKEVLPYLEGQRAYKELLGDFENIAKKLDENPSTVVNNFDGIVARLDLRNKLSGGTGYSPNQVKGADGVVRAFSDDIDDYVGKNITFEKTVKNARDLNSKSFEDLQVEIELPNGTAIQYRVEVKNCTDCVTSSVIKNQFIDRDLFNATSVDQIRWRVYEQNFSASDLTNFMKDNKAALDNLPPDKKNLYFVNFSELDGVTDQNISQFVADNFSKIFE